MQAPMSAAGLPFVSQGQSSAKDKVVLQQGGRCAWFSGAIPGFTVIYAFNSFQACLFSLPTAGTVVRAWFQTVTVWREGTDNGRGVCLSLKVNSSRQQSGVFGVDQGRIRVSIGNQRKLNPPLGGGGMMYTLRVRIFAAAAWNECAFTW
mmetsp:Transcript_79566/g.140405  ORF Transcript_79566/g.140405 Transcript_79566/m.140405 type:complete len:149 (+) Transcript_79566:1411-1857(+)